MNNHACRAIENGLIAQLMKSVTPMPRQWHPSLHSERKSIFISIGPR
ncbi:MULTISPECIES: hypothetical protein [unclassified Ensifer]|nr:MULTISPECIES: hypothetical protein [unclassified Ensifer]